MGDEDELICGENYDHDIVITYEDDELRQWRCDHCGAEGEDDMDLDTSGADS